MQTQSASQQEPHSSEEIYTASLYRTRWLMAHNRLHALAHDSSLSSSDQFNAYVEELKSSEAVAKTPA